MIGVIHPTEVRSKAEEVLWHVTRSDGPPELAGWLGVSSAWAMLGPGMGHPPRAPAPSDGKADGKEQRQHPSGRLATW